MRVIIAGSRWITDADPVVEAIEASGWRDQITTVIQGGCRGVDRTAKEWAFFNRKECVTVRADWKAHGRSAGPLRNRVMLGRADAVIAVWDGCSRGTADMIRATQEAGVPLYVHRVAARAGVRS